jgi:hypothetical protein
MPPTMMFSIGVGGSKVVAEAHVERAEQEEGERGAHVDQVIHNSLSWFSLLQCAHHERCIVNGAVMELTLC